ncbi:MAG: FAD/NAD(P)-binding protein [Proteobacteria bacterium]|nr:FAD/NAD(P)-binding protein [Pseudomonadota bacterium]
MIKYEQKALLNNPYLPLSCRIVASTVQTDDTMLFKVRFEDDRDVEAFDHKPGQFVQLSVMGTGECPISIASSPTRHGTIDLCIRKAGRVTEAFHNLGQNAVFGMRGPYGNGYPVEVMEGNNLLIVAGGLGMAPLRSLLWYALDHRHRFKDIILMYGTKNQHDFLFKGELLSLINRNDIKTLLAVAEDIDGSWTGEVGLVTDLFDHAELDAGNTFAAICGPPVMYKYVIEKLLEKGFSKGRILMSLERKMKCGIGKCVHCSVGFKYTCIDGPIFTYWDAINMREII